MKRTLYLRAITPLCALLFASLAHAQATRTWVSGVGDDANPCSRTAPCKTFQGAISKTAPAGEINVLDPGGFGAVTITKSITISNEGVGEAGILVSGTNGVVISAQPTDVITLRGLVFNGLNTGLSAVKFINGGTLNIENCKIFEFNGTSNPNGSAVDFQPTTAASLNITDTQIYNNQGSVAPGAILVKPGAGGSVNGTFTRVNIYNNFGDGIKVDGTTASSNAVNLTVQDSTISNHSAMGVQLIGAAGLLNVSLFNSSITNNATFGVRAQQASATARIGNDTIAGNGTGIGASGGGALVSYGNNNISGNTTDGSPTSTVGTH